MKKRKLNKIKQNYIPISEVSIIGSSISIDLISDFPNSSSLSSDILSISFDCLTEFIFGLTECFFFSETSVDFKGDSSVTLKNNYCINN
jgi:hypothetical protein